jgi:hypothetical protein
MEWMFDNIIPFSVGVVSTVIAGIILHCWKNRFRFSIKYEMPTYSNQLFVLNIRCQNSTDEDLEVEEVICDMTHAELGRILFNKPDYIKIDNEENAAIIPAKKMRRVTARFDMRHQGNDDVWNGKVGADLFQALTKHTLTILTTYKGIKKRIECKVPNDMLNLIEQKGPFVRAIGGIRR